MACAALLLPLPTLTSFIGIARTLRTSSLLLLLLLLLALLLYVRTSARCVVLVAHWLIKLMLQ
jgi:hypothetical protein